MAVRGTSRQLSLVALLPLLATAASAQVNSAAAAPAAATPAAASTCFRARPLPRCHAWIPFQVTGVGRLAGTSHQLRAPGGLSTVREPDLQGYGAWDVGYMVNRDSAHAVGASLQVGGTGSGTRLALKARRRQWLSRLWAVDVAAGPLVSQEQGLRDGVAETYGLTGETGIDLADQLGLVLSGDWSTGAGHSGTALHLGARTGSFTSVGVTALVAIGTMVAVNSLSGGWGDCCTGLMTQRLPPRPAPLR